MNQVKGETELKLRAVLIMLVLIMLAGCTAGERPVETDDTTPPSTAESVSPPQTGQMSPSPPETESQPILGAPISEVSISSADEWNEFATSFNDGSAKYADFITITIHGALDFSGISFVPLYSGFAGIICGATALQTGDWEQDNVFPSESREYEIGFHNIRSIETVTGKPVLAYGESYPAYLYNFSQSAKLDEAFMTFTDGIEYTSPDSLFGLVSESLTIENLAFTNISSEKLSSLFSHSCANLTVRNTAIRQCQLPVNGKAMLAANTNSLSIESLLVYCCDMNADIYAAGLVRWVGGDAAFKNIYLYHFDFQIYPDLGSSGYPLAYTGVLGQHIFGSASFDSIELYGCKVLGAGTSVLFSNVSGEVEKCSNISVERCSLLGYQCFNSMFPPSELMFYSYTQKPVFEENVSFKDCLLNAYVSYTGEDGASWPHTDPETYIARGYTFDNCSFVNLPVN